MTHDHEHDDTLRFVHLHLHSDASRIDGLGPIGRTVNAARDKGMEGMALTDHGTLANTIAFMSATKAAGLKGIMGMEAYVADAGKTYHLTLLADGNEGLNTLIQLNNIGQKGEYNKPAFSLNDFKKHNKGITVLTGCPASPMQDTEWGDARKIGLYLKGIFQDRLFAEYMFVANGHSWDRSHKLATDLKLRPVVTNDTHFPYPEDAASHSVLVQLKANFSYESKLLYLATAHDIMERVVKLAPHLYEATEKGIRNSYRLLNKLASPTFSSEPSLPKVIDADEQIWQRAIEALAVTTPATGFDAQDYRERLEYEYAVVKEMGFNTYFFILMDIIAYAKRVGVRVGPGRGSGAGSLLLFLLGITEIDPMQYGLQFERFLNPKRKEMPDVDTDFDSDGRDLVLEYAHKKWGGLPIATYARYTDKTLIADLARHYRVPRDVSQAAADGGETSAEFQRIARMNPAFGPTYHAMLGQIKQIGQHAGGVIITDANVPLERTAHGGTVAAWTEGENRELTQAGVVKYDLLGISALSVLRRLETKHGKHATKPDDTSPVMEIFRSGDTVGIFQFSGSDGIVNFTKRVNPQTFADLVAINALYRPGALDSGAAEHYPEWRHKPRLLHPLVDPILAETFGVICYQEQFMKIFAVMTKGDLAEADIARKTIVKSKPGNPDWEAKMAKLRADFYRGGANQDVPSKTVELIWTEILTHARYSFNKSHAVAYTELAWEMAWWKHHHRADFFAAMLSVDPTQAQRYLFDVVSSGIEIVPPHINRSSKDYESDGIKIYLPLSAIKFLGGNGVNAILEARPFASIDDFMKKVNKRQVPGRARLGLFEMNAFDGLEGDRKVLGIIDIMPMSEVEKQETYLGFMLPTKKFIRAIRAAEKQGMLGGIISEVIDRESKFGKYKVYRLLPHGTFWSRNIMSLKEGDMVKVKIKKDSGKALSVSPLF